KRMRAGPLRSAPLAGLVSAHHAVHAGPCSVIRVASAWRKKLQTHKCGSAHPNCAICSPRCYGAGGTALSTCCIGPSGEDDINSELCPATIESADRLCPHSIYNCSTRLPPIGLMICVAAHADEKEIQAAAAYFSGLKPKPWIRVVETSTVPKTHIAGRMLGCLGPSRDGANRSAHHRDAGKS